MISKYFGNIKQQIKKYSHIVESYHLNEKVYSDERGYIAGYLLFIDDSKLSLAEVKDTEQKEKIKYQYHYMDKDNNMIFRYDNAKHYKEVKTFPHHKHLPSDILESVEPEINTVLGEIEVIILKE